MAGDVAFPPAGRAHDMARDPAQAAPSSARIHAIARLRRAASQREIRAASPRRAPEPDAENTAQVAPSLPETSAPGETATDAPRLCTSSHGTARGSGSPPAEPPAPALHDDSLLTSPLPSLDQLRQRILQERQRSGLSRSASTSATSKMARAYTMQKLLGASTPVPYHDMFAFVRSVNEAQEAQGLPPVTMVRPRQALSPRRPKDSAAAEEGAVADDSDGPAAAAAPASLPWQTMTLAAPRHDGDRTAALVTARLEEHAAPPTLIRSVSAREIAHRRMLKKRGRLEEATTSLQQPIQTAAPHAPAETEARGSAAERHAPPLDLPRARASHSSETDTHESSSTSSWRLSLYDYGASSPTSSRDEGPPSARNSDVASGPMASAPLSSATTTAAAPAPPIEWAGLGVSWPATANVDTRIDASKSGLNLRPRISGPPAERPSSGSVPGRRRSSGTHSRMQRTPTSSAASPRTSAFGLALTAAPALPSGPARVPTLRHSRGTSSAPSSPTRAQLAARSPVASAAPSLAPLTRAAPPPVAASSPAPTGSADTTGVSQPLTPSTPAIPFPSSFTVATPLAPLVPPPVSRSVSGADGSSVDARAPPPSVGVPAPPVPGAVATLPYIMTPAPGPRAPSPPRATAPTTLPPLAGVGHSPDTSGTGAASADSSPNAKPLPRVPPWAAHADVRRDDAAPARPDDPLSKGAGLVRSASLQLRRAASSGHLRREAQADDLDQDKRGASVTRLFGTLRRKASRRALTTARRAPKWSEHDTSLASLTLQSEVREGPLHDVVVSLPVSPAALMQWNQTLARPVCRLLSRFPAELPVDVARDPPRHLRRVLPLLQAAGDEYVKLRYVFVFDDVMVLAKPAIHLRPDESLSDFILRKLGSAPDLGETCAPFAVLDLAHTQLDEPLQGADEAELRALVLRHEAALLADWDGMLPALAAQARPGVPDTRTRAELLFVGTMLPRARVSQYLFLHTDVLVRYLAMYRFHGVPLEASLRTMLLDLCWPQDSATWDLMLTTFAAQWLMNNAPEAPQYTLAAVTDLTYATVALHEALHAAPGGGTGPSLDQFLRQCRLRESLRPLSDHELGGTYMAVRAAPLRAAPAPDATRTISIDTSALRASALTLGVPSAAVHISIDAPDPELRVRLFGRGLYMDPPVLTFAHHTDAEFTVCQISPGPHELVFVRTGRHAHLYTGTTPRSGWQALPRHLSLCADSSATRRPTVTLLHAPSPPAAPQSFSFFLTDTASAHNIAAMLRTSIDTAQAHERALSPPERDARVLAHLVLESTLLADTADARRSHAREKTRTGHDIAQVTRDHSLLTMVLSSAQASPAPGAQGITSPGTFAA